MYKIYFSDYFKKQLKKLKKKYPSVKADLLEALKPFDKKSIVSLGHKLYKIRVGSSDVKRGKRSSFRTIVLLMESKNLIIPIAIFYKGDRADLRDKEIEKYLDKILKEISP